MKNYEKHKTPEDALCPIRVYGAEYGAETMLCCDCKFYKENSCLLAFFYDEVEKEEEEIKDD